MHELQCLHEELDLAYAADSVLYVVSVLDTPGNELGLYPLVEVSYFVYDRVTGGFRIDEGAKHFENVCPQGEVACTRPVVDKKWLEKTRQVGTSGVTVKPRVYLALGISGSFQHLGGVKGDPFIAAINTDPSAPIFDVADVGIVGDILDLIPLLEEKIRERRG